jgi:outer membrane receptor protein involved in Fe transport
LPTPPSPPRLELTGGVRLLIEDRKSEYSNYQPNSVLLSALGSPSSLLGLANTNGQVFAAKASYFAALPRFNALYRVNRNVNLYATISEGRYSPVVQLASTTANGVVVPAVQYIPAETLWNFEGGMKGRIGRLSGALSVFYQAYKGFQVSVIRNGVGVTESAGAAHNPGVEAEGTYTISPILSLTGTFAYLHGRIDSDASNGTYAGNHFRLQPDYSGSLAVNLRVPVRDDLLVYFAPNWTYRSSVYFEMPNKAAIAQEAYSLYNLRGGVEFGPGKRYSVGGFVRNLGNRHYLLDAGNTGGTFGTPTYIAGEPRMYGIEASARF